MSSRPLVPLTAAALITLAGCSSSADPADASSVDATVTADASSVDATVPADTGATGDADARVPVDGAMDAALSDDGGLDRDAGSMSDAGAPACGSERPDLASTGGSEGLAIARDGTIYYSQSGGVGRIRPGMAPENDWVTIQRGATIWGVVLDADNSVLYVASPTTRAIHAVTTATGGATVLAERVGQPNGITLGPDGAVYASDFGGGRVVRIDADSGTLTVVSTSRLAQPNGVAFLDSGELLVGSYMSGDIHALTLDAAHVESSRRTVATGLGRIDGLAVATDGTIFATDQGASRLIEVGADGRATVLLRSLSAPANVELGAGVLSCTDVYVATGDGLVRYEMGSRRQRAVPWH